MLETLRMLGARPAAIALLIALGALAVFHVLMLLGVLPPEIAWGGRGADSEASLQALEAVGLIVTLVFAAVVAAKAGFLGTARTRKAIGLAMWVVFGYFVLNVFTNLVSTSTLERAIFIPVSVVLALLSLRVAVES